jgi:hypothetical protein
MAFWTSNPARGLEKLPGGFDSHTFPPALPPLKSALLPLNSGRSGGYFNRTILSSLFFHSPLILFQV